MNADKTESKLLRVFAYLSASALIGVYRRPQTGPGVTRRIPPERRIAC